MRTRVLGAVLIMAGLTAAVIGFLLFSPDGAETPEPQTTTEQALAGFVAGRFGVGYIGRCPKAFPADGDVPRGMCSARLAGAGDRILYRLGDPFGEWVGEATLVRDPSRSWHVTGFEEYPPLGG